MATYSQSSSAHYTRGYRPVAAEVSIARPTVLGELPERLNGSFLRIGPNPLGAADAARCGPLAGDAMVHGIALRDGRAEWYRNRWLRTDRAVRALGGLPTPGPRRGLSDNASGNIIRHAGRTLALGDGGALPVELSVGLDTVARSDFDGTLPGGFSAHPARDQVTGELYAVAYSHEEPVITYLTIDVHGKVRRAEPIAMKRTSMMHAFSLTERHAVIYDLPVVFSAEAAASGSRVPYAWNENHGARLGVLPREGDDADVLWMDIAPCYVFHPVNAYETGRALVVDVIRHERVFDRDQVSPGEGRPALWRWTIDRLSGTVAEEQLDDRTEEFPRIDDRYSGSAHRYAFATAMRGSAGDTLAGRALLRHDLVAGRTDVHNLGLARMAGEMVFVPRTPDAPEADGWLLTLVYDACTDRSELIVLDTEDFNGPPVAVVKLPVRVPHGLHATWIAEH
jgi:carotenoid cleavage dioxygenase